MTEQRTSKAKEAKAKSSSMVDYVVEVNRVTKVTKGGKRFSFAALVVSGDGQGSIGVGLGKGREVSNAIAKATNRARKNMINYTLRGTTIPYNVEGYHGSSKVILRSAYKGTGVIAGGPVRAIMFAFGASDILGKSLGSSNKKNVVKATLNALAKLRTAERIAQMRGKTVKEIVHGAREEKNIS